MVGEVSRYYSPPRVAMAQTTNLDAGIGSEVDEKYPIKVPI
jgi:hypothetical protein